MPYSINYTNVVYDNLPPDKRTSRHAQWLIALLTPLSWLRDLFLVDYMQGANYPTYQPTITYAKGDRVIFARCVWESLIENNYLKPIPGPKWWKKVQDTFIGAEERLRYSGHKLVLEYALNKLLGTAFKQPPEQSVVHITTLPPVQMVFWVNADGSASGSCGFDDSFGYVKDTHTNYQSEEEPSENFTIYVPDDISIADLEQTITSFAKQYVPQGITFKIEIYETP